MKKALRVLGAVCGVLVGAAEAVAETSGSSKEKPSVEPIGRGITLEANIGASWLRAAPNHHENVDKRAMLLSLGIGGWISSQAVLTMRLTWATDVGDGMEIPGGFAGGAIQLWPCKRFWFGGGLGVGVAKTTFSSLEEESEAGFAVNGRAGIVPYINGDSTINLSFDVTSLFLEKGSVTSFGVMLGYQAL